MKGVKRLYIDIDWDTLQEVNPEISDSQIRCMERKWSPFKEWEQGFDSDCAIHCSKRDSCMRVFYDEDFHFKNHFKEIIIPCDKKLWWGDEEVLIQDAKKEGE